MVKKILHKFAVRAERVADKAFQRTAEGREIDPYIGYSTPTQIIIRGRVLTKLRATNAVATQSNLANLRDMIGLFLTDEVRDATVRCGDVTARTDEEGYFTLVLPRDDRRGWDTELIRLEGRAEPVACPFMIPQSDAKFLVISDIDDTMLETGAYSLWRNLVTSLTGNSNTRRIFPDAAELMKTLSQDGQNPVFYVSSSPWNMHSFLAKIFERASLVRGPMFLRDLGLSETKFITEGHGNHKGASIDQILRANPDLPAILLGDTGQHDAQIYRAAVERHPDRIFAVGLRTPGPGLDAADHGDIAQLRKTGLPIYAAPNFDGLKAVLVHARPDLMAQV